MAGFAAAENRINPSKPPPAGSAGLTKGSRLPFGATPG